METVATPDRLLQPWSLVGTYFEVCNCEAICPCRKVGETMGAASTDGVCEFALSWHIDGGVAGTTDLGGRDVVLAGRYVDDPARVAGVELGRWEVALYLDEHASATQAAALEAIFLGRAGGTAFENYAAVIDTVHAVRRAAIDLVHEPRRKQIAVADHARVVGRAPVASEEPITCGIPGHDHPGQEWTADVMSVDETGLQWEVRGKCGFSTDFAYRSTVARQLSTHDRNNNGGI